MSDVNYAELEAEQLIRQANSGKYILEHHVIEALIRDVKKLRDRIEYLEEAAEIEDE